MWEEREYQYGQSSALLFMQMNMESCRSSYRCRIKNPIPNPLPLSLNSSLTCSKASRKQSVLILFYFAVIIAVKQIQLKASISFETTAQYECQPQMAFVLLFRGNFGHVWPEINTFMAQLNPSNNWPLSKKFVYNAK